MRIMLGILNHWIIRRSSLLKNWIIIIILWIITRWLLRKFRKLRMQWWINGLSFLICRIKRNHHWRLISILSSWLRLLNSNSSLEKFSTHWCSNRIWCLIKSSSCKITCQYRCWCWNLVILFRWSLIWLWNQFRSWSLISRLYRWCLDR